MLDLTRITLGLQSSSEEHSDAQIEHGVRRVLRSDYNLGRESVEIHVENGVVTLRGTTRSADLRQRASALAAGVAGVREVENRIVVPGEPA